MFSTDTITIKQNRKGEYSLRYYGDKRHEHVEQVCETVEGLQFMLGEFLDQRPLSATTPEGKSND